jgi:hypothetical protein
VRNGPELRGMGSVWLAGYNEAVWWREAITGAGVGLDIENNVNVTD